MPKTATHAIREALRQHLDDNDWEQQVLFGQQSLPIPEIAQLRHGHISVRQIRPHVSSETWDTYFKFGFVRNPFDRFVSTCFFLNRQNPRFAQAPVQLMKRFLTFEKFRQRILVRPQSELLTDKSGEIVVDYVGRYEDLQQSYDEICERIGIPPTDLTRKNPSDHAAFTKYYDDELRDIVAAFYADDFRNFTYDPDSVQPGD